MRRGTDYHRAGLDSATRCARGLRFRDLRRDGRELVLLVARVPVLVAFLARLPSIPIDLSRESQGAFIAEHLGLRRLGAPRFRLAQGVLHIPQDLSLYMRGRKRQAVRTNIHRASERGMICSRTIVPDWSPPDRVSRTKTRAERWDAHNQAGTAVATAWLIVDTDCALLYTLSSTEPYARWLLHTAIVERLADSHCSLLLTNSFDVPLLSAGHQHFQHLLGYNVARLRPRIASNATSVWPRAARTLLGSAAFALILASLVLVGDVDLS